jgi:hypothetical protein
LIALVLIQQRFSAIKTKNKILLIEKRLIVAKKNLALRLNVKARMLLKRNKHTDKTKYLKNATEFAGATILRTL